MPNSDQQQHTPAARKSLALQRAEQALGKVQELATLIAGKSESERKCLLENYVNYVKRLPANILRSGLGQAVAMEKAGARSDEGHKLLYEHIDAWLTADRANAPYRNQAGNLLRAIASNDQGKYVRAQAEALAYLEWLKKFAMAFLDEEVTHSTGSLRTANSVEKPS